jgi:hypothetical protein
MINIKKFIDKVSTIDARSSRDVVLTLSEARMLRDEIAKLLVDRLESIQRNSSLSSEEVTQVEIVGGKW